MERFLHIDYSPRVAWVYPIVNRIRELDGTGTIRTDKWSKSTLPELGFSISTKVRMLDTVVRRVDRGLAELGKEINEKKTAKEHYEQGFALRLDNEDLPYELLIDIDSFINEARSTYEIVISFIKVFHKRIVGRGTSDGQIIAALSGQGLDTAWIKDLKANREEFFHERAAWIAARILSMDPLKIDLLLLRRNVKIIQSEDDYVGFDRLRRIYFGFIESMPKLQKYIVSNVA